MLDTGVDGDADVGLRDDGSSLGPDGQDLRQAVAGALADEDLVGLVREVDGDPDHPEDSTSANTRAATSSRVRSSTSMTASATSS